MIALKLTLTFEVKISILPQFDPNLIQYVIQVRKSKMKKSKWNWTESVKVLQNSKFFKERSDKWFSKKNSSALRDFWTTMTKVVNSWIYRGKVTVKDTRPFEYWNEIDVMWLFKISMYAIQLDFCQKELYFASIEIRSGILKTTHDLCARTIRAMNAKFGCPSSRKKEL